MIPIASRSPTTTGCAGICACPGMPNLWSQSALVGNVLGFAFTGRAGVFAPAELTPDGSGVLAEVASAEEEGIALAEVDLDALQEFRRNHPWRDSNPRLYARYFPSAYQT